MPSVSKSQQRFMGMVRAYQEGKLKHADSKIIAAAKSMSPQDAHDFAVTKHKNLPEKVAAWGEMPFSTLTGAPSLSYDQQSTQRLPGEILGEAHVSPLTALSAGGMRAAKMLKNMANLKSAVPLSELGSAGETAAAGVDAVGGAVRAATLVERANNAVGRISAPVIKGLGYAAKEYPALADVARVGGRALGPLAAAATYGPGLYRLAQNPAASIQRGRLFGQHLNQMAGNIGNNLSRGNYWNATKGVGSYLWDATKTNYSHPVSTMIEDGRSVGNTAAAEANAVGSGALLHRGWLASALEAPFHQSTPVAPPPPPATGLAAPGAIASMVTGRLAPTRQMQDEAVANRYAMPAGGWQPPKPSVAPVAVTTTPKPSPGAVPKAAAEANPIHDYIRKTAKMADNLAREGHSMEFIISQVQLARDKFFKE